MNDSVRFELLIGVNPGYSHDNEVEDPIAEATDAWHAAAEECLAEGLLYIPGSITYCRMLYREEWGCPSGGEDAVMISGVMNKHYYDDESKYIESVRKTALRTKKKLAQINAILSFFRASCEFMQ